MGGGEWTVRGVTGSFVEKLAIELWLLAWEQLKEEFSKLSDQLEQWCEDGKT